MIAQGDRGASVRTGLGDRDDADVADSDRIRQR